MSLYKYILAAKYWLVKIIKSFIFIVIVLPFSFLKSNMISSELISALIGAIIGGLFTCLGVYLQMHQQRVADNDKQTRDEEDKMTYLHYLILDSYMVTEKIATNAISPTRGNPFWIGGLGSVPITNSVKNIAEGINQEHYFLASLNQLNDRSFGEIFSLYNDLNIRIKNLIIRNDKIQNSFVDEKYNVLSARKKLFNELRLYINSSIDKISDNKKRQKIYLDLKVILEKHEQEEKEPFQEDIYEKGLQVYYSIIQILKVGDTEEEKSLLVVAQETYDKDFNFRTKSVNMYNSMITEGAEMKKILDLIRKKAVPLEKYIKNMKVDKK